MASKATVAHRELWSVVAWTLSHEGKRQDCPAAESVPGLGGGGHKPLRSLSAKGEPPRMVCASAREIWVGCCHLLPESSIWGQQIHMPRGQGSELGNLKTRASVSASEVSSFESQGPLCILSLGSEPGLHL